MNMTIATRSNEEIKKDVVDQLYWDSRIDASSIKVEVSDRKVTLTGKVPSYTSKLAAETDTLTIPGISSVENKLEIQHPVGFKLPTDIEIQGNIVNSLIWNTNIDSTNINVSVDKGIVTLDGSVSSYWQKILAEELSCDIAGVISIENKLSVVPTENIIDESIAKAIIASLDRNPNIDVDSLNVKVEEGVVTLSGTVSNWAAYHDILSSARHTVGVINVINNLEIE
jgi:osmotically-inducible protein OsmY